MLWTREARISHDLTFFTRHGIVTDPRSYAGLYVPDFGTLKSLYNRDVRLRVPAEVHSLTRVGVLTHMIGVTA